MTSSRMPLSSRRSSGSRSSIRTRSLGPRMVSHMPAWTNWVGNQTCAPAELAAPRSEDEVAELVAMASAVRVAGAGHSFTPVVLTDGLLLDMSALGGIRSIDPDSRRVVVGPATTIGEFGEPLWAAGLALANQGDIVAQQIAGAVSTATHGSGLKLGCFSSSVRRVRLVTASGAIVEIGEDEPELLRAAQVSVGMLGVMTSSSSRWLRPTACASASTTGAGTRPGSSSTRSRASTGTTRSSGCRPRIGCALRARVTRRVAGGPLPREDLRRGRSLDARLRPAASPRRPART